MFACLLVQETYRVLDLNIELFDDVIELLLLVGDQFTYGNVIGGQSKVKTWSSWITNLTIRVEDAVMRGSVFVQLAFNGDLGSVLGWLVRLVSLVPQSHRYLGFAEIKLVS